MDGASHLPFNGRLAVVGPLETGVGFWPPKPMLRGEGEVSWASDTVLVYPPAERDLYSLSQINRTLAFFDTASGHYLAQIDGFDFI